MPGERADRAELRPKPPASDPPLIRESGTVLEYREASRTRASAVPIRPTPSLNPHVSPQRGRCRIGPDDAARPSRSTRCGCGVEAAARRGPAGGRGGDLRVEGLVGRSSPSRLIQTRSNGCLRTDHRGSGGTCYWRFVAVRHVLRENILRGARLLEAVVAARHAARLSRHHLRLSTFWHSTHLLPPHVRAMLVISPHPYVRVKSSIHHLGRQVEYH